MPGETLLGEFDRWVPDECLHNCCVDNPDEPPEGDDFDSRMQEEANPGWIDTRKDVADFDDDQDSTAGHSADEDEEDDGSTFKVRHTLTLPYIPKDYSRGMEVAIDVEQVAAGSCARLPCSRGMRFKR